MNIFSWKVLSFIPQKTGNYWIKIRRSNFEGKSPRLQDLPSSLGGDVAIWCERKGKDEENPLFRPDPSPGVAPPPLRFWPTGKPELLLEVEFLFVSLQKKSRTQSKWQQ